jgi:hypothetical protein
MYALGSMVIPLHTSEIHLCFNLSRVGGRPLVRMKSVGRAVRHVTRPSFFLSPESQLHVPRSPALSSLSPLGMAEIPSQKYLDMANQAYIVAYVTGPVNTTFLRLSMRSIFNPHAHTAVCAMTLLYDYALTLGEEVSTSPVGHSPFGHLIISRLLPQITRMWTSVTPKLTFIRQILILHSLRFSVIKCLFLVNRYVVLPMSVCVPVSFFPFQVFLTPLSSFNGIGGSISGVPPTPPSLSLNS